MDIFADYEVCNILEIDDNVIIYIDESKENFVYSRHISDKNSEVMCYIEFIRKIISDKLFYFAMNNPKKYSSVIIEKFNEKYDYILKNKYNFILKKEDIFSTIETYLIYIVENPYDEKKLRYHKDLKYIFNEIGKKEGIRNIDRLLLNERVKMKQNNNSRK